MAVGVIAVGPREPVARLAVMLVCTAGVMGAVPVLVRRAGREVNVAVASSRMMVTLDRDPRRKARRQKKRAEDGACEGPGSGTPARSTDAHVRSRFLATGEHVLCEISNDSEVSDLPPNGNYARRVRTLFRAGRDGSVAAGAPRRERAMVPIQQSTAALSLRERAT